MLKRIKILFFYPLKYRASGRKTEKFTVSVNIAAASKVNFELTYEELLKRQFGKYEMFIKVKPKQLVRDFEVNGKLDPIGYCNLRGDEILYIFWKWSTVVIPVGSQVMFLMNCVGSPHRCALVQVFICKPDQLVQLLTLQKKWCMETWKSHYDALG